MTTLTATADAAASEERARRLDASDPLPTRRDEFHLLPYDGAYPEIAYFAGNSLGLQPKSTAGVLQEELDAWARLGVEGHSEATRPWISYHENLRGTAAELMGARPREVVVMNTLTVNLNLLMISFYRPTADRYKILIEDDAFPSDSYAVRSQAALHGFDPDDAIVRVAPRPGEHTLRTEDIVARIAATGSELALVLIGGINYYTGEVVDIPAITAAGHEQGAIVAIDLAHAAGNIELSLHDWDVDWAAWCNYKYLNGGPGAVAGAFVHERHLGDPTIPKLHGWWSTNPDTRFVMEPTVDEQPSADAWAMSNPLILALAPVLASYRMFAQSGLANLRAKSKRLTAYLEAELGPVMATRPMRIITPSDPDRRGAQLSVQFDGIDVGDLAARLRANHGIIADARQPDVIRLAPAPMYSTYHDCWRAAQALAAEVPRV